MKLGYSDPLYILPLDHRGSLARDFLNVAGELTDVHRDKIREFKEIIYNGFLMAITNGSVPKEGAAILIDAEYGEQIVKDAKERKVTTLVTMEKSGTKEFEFDSGEDFKKRLLELKPDFAKALIHYNPDGDKAANERQRSKLKILADFCHEHDIKFLVEPLVLPTEQQLGSVSGNKELFETVLRPSRMIRVIQEFQEDVIDVDVWKIEGFSRKDQYIDFSNHARLSVTGVDRSNVGIVVLGRGESKEMVEKWIRTANGVPGVIGFAVGRTVFGDPLRSYLAGTLSKEAVAQAIAGGYTHFYNVFTGKL